MGIEFRFLYLSFNCYTYFVCIEATKYLRYGSSSFITIIAVDIIACPQLEEDLLNRNFRYRDPNVHHVPFSHCSLRVGHCLGLFHVWIQDSVKDWYEKRCFS